MQKDLDKFVLGMQQQVIERARRQYSETVVEHWLRPRNPGPMENPDGHARIKGPCGDTMEIFIRVDGDTIVTASFTTDGCITSVVSGSMAVELATGRSVQQAIGISQQEILERLGGLPEVSQHCALLAANTLKAAIQDHLRTRSAPWKRLYRNPNEGGK